MGGIKKSKTPAERLLARALSRPEASVLIAKDEASFKMRAMANALRNYPDMPSTERITQETIQKLVQSEALDAEVAKSERLTKVAKKGRKGLSRNFVMFAVDAYAKKRWNAGLPVDGRGWRFGIALEAKVQWRTLKKVLPEVDLAEDDLLSRLRGWKPNK